MAGNQIIASPGRLNSLAGELSSTRSRISPAGVRFSGSMATDYAFNQTLAGIDAQIEGVAGRIGALAGALGEAAAAYEAISRKANYSDVAAVVTGSADLLSTIGAGLGGGSASMTHSAMDKLLELLELDSSSLPDDLNLDALQELVGDSIDLSGVSSAAELMNALGEFANGNSEPLSDMLVNFTQEQGFELLTNWAVSQGMDSSVVGQAINLGSSLGAGAYYGVDAAIDTWGADYTNAFGAGVATVTGGFTGAVSEVALNTPIVSTLIEYTTGIDAETWHNETLPAFVDNLAWASSEFYDSASDFISDVGTGAVNLFDAGVDYVSGGFSSFVNWITG